MVLEMGHDYLTNRVTTSLTPVGKCADAPEPLLRPSPAAGFTPTRRGGGGPVRLLYWAAPTLLNPHLALGPNDFEASEIFYEPLADIAADGTIVPVLAAEVPSADNGGVARDGTWVIWRLKPGVLWHDGRPFTADDVIFTWEYAADPTTTATTPDRTATSSASSG